MNRLELGAMGKLHLGVAILLLGSSAVRAQEVPPPVPAKPSNEVRPAIRWKQFNYTCEGGAKLTVYLHNETAKVRYQDRVYVMTQTRSADGNRYSDGKVVWWGKGNGGVLEEDTPDGNGKMLVKDCEMDKPLNASAVADKVTGTVAYLQRIALPPNAIIQVQLQDVSRADAPAKTIAQEKITLGERQVPVPFEIKVDPAKIDPKHTYALSARIVVDDKLRFVNDKAYPVLTRDNPSHVEMILKAVEDPNRP
jgi:putative lipoprotein